MSIIAAAPVMCVMGIIPRVAGVVVRTLRRIRIIAAAAGTGVLIVSVAAVMTWIGMSTIAAVSGTCAAEKTLRAVGAGAVTLQRIRTTAAVAAIGVLRVVSGAVVWI